MGSSPWGQKESDTTERLSTNAIFEASSNEPGTNNFLINISQVLCEKKGVPPLTENLVGIP